MTSAPNAPARHDRAADPRARLAGLLYLVVIVCGLAGELALRGPLIDPASAEATGAAVRAGDWLLRLSVAADSVMALADVGLAVLFYVLLRTVEPTLALAAAALRLVQAAVIGASLVLLSGVPDLAAAGEDALALTFARLHATGYDIGLIFFGVNALVMARLLQMSGGVPRLLCAGIGAAGAVYLTGSFIRLLAPDWTAAFAPAYAVPLLAESGFCLWLLWRARI